MEIVDDREEGEKQARTIASGGSRRIWSESGGKNFFTMSPYTTHRKPTTPPGPGQYNGRARGN